MTSETDNLRRIQRASKGLERLFKTVTILIPIVGLAFWIAIYFTPNMQQTVLPRYVQLPVPLWSLLLGFAAAMIPGAVAMYGMWVLARLFKLYSQGSIFRKDNVQCFRSLSRVMLLWFVASIVSVPIRSVVLTLHHAKGERCLELSLGSADLTALLVGLVVGVIAWVMDEARKMQEEQDFTI